MQTVMKPSTLRETGIVLMMIISLIFLGQKILYQQELQNLQATCYSMSSSKLKGSQTTALLNVMLSYGLLEIENYIN